MMTELVHEWISCNSPLLLLAKDQLDAWEGSDVPSRDRSVEAKFRWNADGPATDYDRACDVNEYVGLIAVGHRKGVVLGDEPLMTTWLPMADGGLLVRWVHADNEETVLAAAQRISDEAFEDSGLRLEVGPSPLVLFAACESGHDRIYPRIEFELPCGRYRILTSLHRPDESTSLICHRLQAEPKSL